MFYQFGKFLSAGLVFSGLKSRDPPVLTSIVVPDPVNISRSGHVSKADAQTFIYEAFDVPEGATSIYVGQKYSKALAGNRLDLGIWDQRGHNLALDGNFTTGFRGWSGYTRNEFSISPQDATPGYLAGPVEPGSWAVGMAAHEVSEHGIDYDLEIEVAFDPVSSFFKPSYAPSRVGNATTTTRKTDKDKDAQVSLIEPALTWYRGDLHTHSIYSDGAQTPQQIVSGAQAANLSFFFSTEHNTQALDRIFGKWAPDDMLVARGIEITTMAGHWNALGVNWDQWVEFRYKDDKGLVPAVQNLRRHGGFAGLNHPYITGCYLCDWLYSNDSFAHMDSLEVWNGAWAVLNERALSLWQDLLVNGSHITAVGGSDSHDANRRVGEPSTVVRAAELSTPAVLDALRASRAYVARYADVHLGFTVQDGDDNSIAHVGDTVNRRGSAGSLSAVLTTSGVPNNARAIFVSDKGKFHNETQSLDHVRVDIGKDASFVRVEVRDGDDGMLGLTNPIWLE